MKIRKKTLPKLAYRLSKITRSKLVCFPTLTLTELRCCPWLIFQDPTNGEIVNSSTCQRHCESQDPSNPCGTGSTLPSGKAAERAQEPACISPLPVLVVHLSSRCRTLVVQRATHWMCTTCRTFLEGICTKCRTNTEYPLVMGIYAVESALWALVCAVSCPQSGQRAAWSGTHPPRRAKAQTACEVPEGVSSARRGGGKVKPCHLKRRWGLRCRAQAQHPAAPCGCVGSPRQDAPGRGVVIEGEVGRFEVVASYTSVLT